MAIWADIFLVIVAFILGAKRLLPCMIQNSPTFEPLGVVWPVSAWSIIVAPHKGGHCRSGAAWLNRSWSKCDVQI